MRTPVLADVAEVQNVLASIAQRHFESQVVKEVDSLASFMCAVKGRGGFLVSMKCCLLMHYTVTVAFPGAVI